MYCCAFWLARELTQVYFSQAETNIRNLVMKLVVSFLNHISIPVSELQNFGNLPLTDALSISLLLFSLMACCVAVIDKIINQTIL